MPPSSCDFVKYQISAIKSYELRFGGVPNSEARDMTSTLVDVLEY